MFKTILETNNIFLNNAAYSYLDMLSNCTTRRHTHIAFLFDQYNNILSYKSNVYFKTKTYPYTQHAEIATIVNFYSKQFIKQSKSTNSILLVIKLNIKSLGCSKPCKHCARFILNNWANLKLKKVIYSDKNGLFNTLSKKDLIDGNFCPSSAFRPRK
jgi:cytidine deaminase